MSQLDKDPHVERKLRGAWHRGRLRNHVRGFSHVAIWFVGIFLAFFALDRLLLFGLPTRMIVLAVALGILASVLIRRWLRGLARYDRRAIAATFERTYPDLTGLLLAYVELAGPAAERAHGSETLKAVVYDQAIAASGPIRAREAIELRGALPTLGAGICALLIGLVVAVTWTDQVTVFARRLLGEPVTYPTRTLIVSITGDQTLKQGEPIDLTVQVRGIIPQKSTLRIQVPGAEWESIEMSKSASDRFARRFESLTTSFRYEIQTGDARSDIYTIDVIPPPTIIKARITVHPPPYTQLPPYDLKTLNIEVPGQSRVEWQLEYDTRLASVSFLAGVAEPEPVSISPDGYTVNFSRRASDPVTYRYRTTRRDTNFEYDGALHRVYVRPDAQPEVSILSPAGNIRATVNKTLAVEFKARDDYGVTAAWLVYSLNEGKESRIDLGRLPHVSGQDESHYPRYGVWPFVWDLKHHVPDLRVGDTIAFAIEVADVRAESDQPTVARSQERTIRVVSYSAYQGHIFAQLTEVQEHLADVHLEAHKSKQALEALKKQVGP